MPRLIYDIKEEAEALAKVHNFPLAPIYRGKQGELDSTFREMCEAFLSRAHYGFMVEKGWLPSPAASFLGLFACLHTFSSNCVISSAKDIIARPDGHKNARLGFTLIKDTPRDGSPANRRVKKFFGDLIVMSLLNKVHYDRVEIHLDIRAPATVRPVLSVDFRVWMTKV